jgi:hypothetical protein
MTGSEMLEAFGLGKAARRSTFVERSSTLVANFRETDSLTTKAVWSSWLTTSRDYGW